MQLKVTIQDTETTFYGHGKLLLTGEYFVLDGAKALAIPTKFGQSLRVKKLSSEDGLLYWVALNNKKQPWLNLVFNKGDFSCITSKQSEAERLSMILKEARKLNPHFLTDKYSLAVETRLEFPNEWGLGSSSTLIYCLSQWAGINGYKLLKNTIGGSGYDVACAGCDLPIVYELKNGALQVFPVQWSPSFSKYIYFAYTGKKQISADAIQYYKTQLINKTETIEQLNRITDAILKSTDLQEFEGLLQEHETIIAASLKMKKVKDTMFADYRGCVKSLGAWGGDFVLMTNEGGEKEIKDYLSARGVTTLFSWENLILGHQDEGKHEGNK